MLYQVLSPKEKPQVHIKNFSKIGIINFHQSTHFFGKTGLLLEVIIFFKTSFFQSISENKQ